MEISRRKLFGIFGLAILATSLFSYSLYVLASGSSSSKDGTSGVYPGAPSYTVWNEGSTYYAKDAYGNMLSGYETGSSNATEVIDSALNSLTIGRQSKETVLIKGDITISTEITMVSNAKLQIEGSLLLNDATMHGINIGSSATNYEVCNGKIKSLVNATNGAGIYIHGAGLYGLIHDMTFNNVFVAISCDSTEVFVDTIDIRDAVYTGIEVLGGNDLFLSRIIVDGGSSKVTDFGLHIRSTNALWCRDADIMRCDYGTLIDPLTDHTAQNAFFSDSALGDSCSKDGCYVGEWNGGTVLSMYFTNCWFSTDDYSGCHINGGDRYSFVGCRFLSNTLNGLGMEDGTNVEINGGESISNGEWGLYETSTIDYSIVIGHKAVSNTISGIRIIGVHSKCSLCWNGTSWIP